MERSLRSHSLNSKNGYENSGFFMMFYEGRENMLPRGRAIGDFLIIKQFILRDYLAVLLV